MVVCLVCVSLPDAILSAKQTILLLWYAVYVEAAMIIPALYGKPLLGMFSWCSLANVVLTVLATWSHFRAQFTDPGAVPLNMVRSQRHTTTTTHARTWLPLCLSLSLSLSASSSTDVRAFLKSTHFHNCCVCASRIDIMLCCVLVVTKCIL